MKRKVLLFVVYLICLSYITLETFGNKIFNSIKNKITFYILTNTFNKKIKITNLTKENYKFWKLIERMILHYKYFNHKTIIKIIKEGYTDENFSTIYELWNKMEIKNEELFLYYSDMFNVGIFLPVFLPVAVHFYKMLRNK